ncbi:MAG: AcrB/AcrD/AcrF family protein [Desulfuromonas sp.]|nr:MAG: AcrB/AcrD/AcrF family protein [Desulfuromonas sp.]
MSSPILALRKRTMMIVMTIMVIGSGILAFQKLGRLENPTFTIKTALVVTAYPGASPLEVEEEVTDVIEEAIQSMGQVKQIYSTSKAGLSLVYVDMKDTFRSHQLPQIWDELRRKIGDVRSQLPPGCATPVVNDDFGDVYGVLFALTGENKSYAELKDTADYLKNELLLCDDVAKIALWGTRQEVIYVEYNTSQLARLGITPTQIYQTLQAKNLVQESGKVKVGEKYIRIVPTGGVDNVQIISDLLLGGANGTVRLSDVARIYRGYVEPPHNLMRFNGQPAIGLGISTLDGGNVITMGQSVDAKLDQLKSSIPDGITLHTVYYQSNIVTEAIDLFITNLVEAVLIVIILLMLFMGWRSGLLIGSVLLLTILGTLTGMYVLDITLQKISLGALVLALGMLVDNAIVICDSTQMGMEQGKSVEKAAEDAVQGTKWPLLGATFVAILAFTAIGFSPGNVGEFCRSLFDVMALSLLLSWVLAISVTPLFCVWFLKPAKNQEQGLHDRPMYKIFRRTLHLCMKQRWLVVLGTFALLVVAMWSFQFLDKAFFPNSSQRYFYINFWNPQGTHIDETSEDLRTMEQYLATLDGIKNTTSFVGEGALRFILSYDYEDANTSYGQIVVEVDDYRKIPALMDQVEAYMQQTFPQAEPYTSRIVDGPGVPFKVEVRFRGPDTSVLKNLAGQAEQILEDSHHARDIRTDWRQQVAVIRPHYSEAQGRFAGISRNNLMEALQGNFNGQVVGIYREADELLPIIFRAPAQDRASVNDMENIQVWSDLHQRSIPLRQVVTAIEPQWEDPLIQRRDRERTITVQSNAINVTPDALRLSILPKINNIELPAGYTMEWGGEYEDSEEAQAGLRQIFPLCFLGMFLIVVWLFDSFRRPLIILLTVPLSLIGVVLGLIVTGLPFGFMSILGFLGLSGMLIKNAIVLIDQIELELQAGMPAYEAVVDSTVNRLRPVLMASGTTILGMAPLITNPFYASMAATIMGGLLVATFLTLVIVPVVYTLVYKITPEVSHDQA